MEALQTETCPCSSGLAPQSCCQPYLTGEHEPPTAEALMRSRYTAYATGNIDYIMATQESGEDADRESTEAWSRESEWLGLEIVQTVGGAREDSVGTVEFIARYSHQGSEEAHHEESSFRRVAGRWLLADGKMKSSPFRRSTPKIKPNEPCPCGSRKKFKKCCGKK